MEIPVLLKVEALEKINNLQRQQNFAAALVCIDEALKRLPDDVQFQIKRGAVLRQLQCLDESVALLTALVEQNPNHLGAKYELAISLRLIGDYERSLALSEASLAVNPSHRPSLLARVDTNIHAGNFAAALVCIDEALELFPDDVQFQIKRGAVLRQLQCLDESVALLTASVEQNPNHLGAKYELALSLRLIGDYERSLALSEASLAVNPSHRPSLFYGSFDNQRLIIVVGRANVLKKSSSIARIIENLYESGFSVCFFPYDANKNNSIISAELLEFLTHFPSRRVFIFSHSAGGIIASLSASEAVVAKIVCFGYPFKHPENEEEPDRTNHLSEIQKPFLIIQGNTDIYGTAESARRYYLSSSISVVSVESDHDYNNMAESELYKCLNIIYDFFT